MPSCRCRAGLGGRCGVAGRGLCASPAGWWVWCGWSVGWLGPVVGRLCFVAGCGVGVWVGCGGGVGVGVRVRVVGWLVLWHAVWPLPGWVGGRVGWLLLACVGGGGWVGWRVRFGWSVGRVGGGGWVWVGLLCLLAGRVGSGAVFCCWGFWPHPFCSAEV